MLEIQTMNPFIWDVHSLFIVRCQWIATSGLNYS